MFLLRMFSLLATVACVRGFSVARSRSSFAALGVKSGRLVMSSGSWSSPNGQRSSTSFSSNVVAEGEMRTFAGYSIYKSKTALNIKPVGPTFNQLNKNSRTINREGSLFLEFAPIGQTPREYNWGAKSVFSLNAGEVGSFLAMDPVKGIEFTHDPNMGGQGQGQVVKRLRLATAPDGKGMFFNLQVTQAGNPTNFSILLSWGELEVLKITARFCLPYFLGFDQIFSNPSFVAPASP